MVRFSKSYWLIFAVLAVTYAANAWLRAPKISAGGTAAIPTLAPELPGWRMEQPPLAERVAQQLKADRVLLYNYYDAHNRRVEFFVGYYEDQQFGAQVHSPLHCLPGAGWTVLHNEKFPLPFAHLPGAASKLDISKKTEQQIVVYWFVSDEEVVKNEMDLKLRLLRNAFLRRVTSVYFYRVCVTQQEGAPDAAMKLLQDFLTALGSHLQPHNPARRMSEI